MRPKVKFNSPKEGQKVGGKLAVTGKATKGTLGVEVVQVRTDGGGWADASGNSTWTFTLDTTRLKNGRYTLEARAYDGMDYSAVVNRTMTVDNAQGGKGFIPGFTGPLALFAVVLIGAMAIRRSLRKS